MNTHDFFESASSISTVIMAIAALVALKQVFMLKEQLKIASDSLRIASESLLTAKADILIRSRREAVALAADRCEKFSKTIEDLKPAIIAVLGPAEVYPNWNLTNVRVQRQSIRDPEAALEWADEICSSPKNQHTLCILNTLEAFAIYFESGAADEQTAFPVTSAVFCGYIDWLFPILVKLRKGADNINTGQFPNIVALYER